MEGMFVRAAGEIAREAGQLLKHFSDHHKLNVEHKGSGFDFVTNADRESQRLVAERLKAAFPDHGFVGEEDNLPDAQVAALLDRDSYCWVCDPLDGTVNYIHHLGLYAVSVGLVRAGKAVAGAIYLPEWDELYTAERGGGAFCNGRPIAPSDCDDLRQAFVTADIAASNPQLKQSNLERILRVAMASGGLRIEGSACVCIAQTACGRQDAYWNRGLHAWDVAAGVVLLEEAGCAVSTVYSDPFDFSMKDGFLCTAPGLKGAFREVIGRV